MSITCCPLSGADGADPPSFHEKEIRRAAKEHSCCECQETIKVGDQHEHVTGCWDGSMDRYRTCLSCVEIRDHFSCDGFIYGQLWSDLEENFFPDMKAGGPCMEGLSPAAKGRLFERRLEWMFRSGIEIDGARPPEPKVSP